jgi:8-amino-7-oxononanoate synthase
MPTPTLELKNARYETLSLRRKRQRIEEKNHNHIVIDGKALINFSSNDYLSLCSDVKIKAALKEGAEKFGLGSSASALICGYHSPHQVLEEKFAAFLKRERALLFSSGYLANLAVMNTLTTKNSAVFSDKLCHASLLDAITLSQAKHYRYQHNTPEHLEFRLTQNDLSEKYIVTESIFSMEGDIAKIIPLAHIAKKSNTTLIVDDAHGFGVLGATGRGICEAYHLSPQQVPVLVTPLGKALGSMGAIVSGSEALIESLIQFARPYIYTTALPPAIAYATSAALDIVQHENWRREKLQHLIHYFVESTRERKLPIQSTEITPIKCLMIGENKKALALQELLKQNGFWVYAVRPPTVPENTARLRISLNCSHTEKEIMHLLDLISDFLHA